MDRPPGPDPKRPSLSQSGERDHDGCDNDFANHGAVVGFAPYRYK